MEALLTVDKDDEAYWQKYPFGGPDAARNQKVLRALRSGVLGALSTPSTSAAPTELVLERVDDAAGRSTYLLDGQRTPAPFASGAVEPSFEWKALALASLASATPAQPVSHILCLGPGDGTELRVLRATYPDAHIQAVDWIDNCDPALLVQLDVTMLETDLTQYLATTPQTFDLIFSNHVFEHMYRIHAVLDACHARLNPGGRLAAAMPLCMSPTPYARTVAKKLDNPARIRLLDLSLIDVGHPWKVDETALAACMAAHGFADITVARCRNMHVRNKAIDPAAHRDSQRDALNMYRVLDLLKGPASRALEFGMNRGFPLWPLALKVFYAVESRLPRVGGNRIANFVPEVLVVSTRAQNG